MQDPSRSLRASFGFLSAGPLLESSQPSPRGRGQGEGLSRVDSKPIMETNVQKLRDRARELRKNQTDVEARIWSRLRGRQVAGAKFRRQYPIGHFIADFCCVELRLVVELDGGQHAEAGAFDQRRTDFLVAEGYRVLRFWNNEVMENIDGVLERILETLTLPSPKGRG